MSKQEQAKAKANEQDGEVKAMLQTILHNQQELTERLGELEEDKEKGTAGEALLQMVNFLYNTDDKHISELTRIPIQAARPLSYAMGLGSLITDREEARKHPEKEALSLSQRILLGYFRLMRSVGGVHLGRGIRLAEEQAAAVAEEAEKFELGGED